MLFSNRKIKKMIKERMDILIESHRQCIKSLELIPRGHDYDMERNGYIKLSEIRIEQWKELNALYQKIK